MYVDRQIDRQKIEEIANKLINAKNKSMFDNINNIENN